MALKKNDIFSVRIEDMSEDGAGIGKKDGYTWFVKDAVMGDLVEAGVTKVKKNYGFARLIRVLEPSPYRIEPRCPAARACGGCQLQAMSYEAQLKFKERKIYQSLKRIGGVEGLVLPGEAEEQGQLDKTIATAEDDKNVIEMEPIIGMENPWRYRNKAQVPFGRDKNGHVIFGFYAGRTHVIVQNEDCLLGIEENREILVKVRNFMEEFHIAPYEETSHTGLVRHVLVRKGFRTGEIMVCLVICGRKIPHEEILVERLKQVKGVVSVSCNCNREKTNVILGKETKVLYGPGYITDYIGNVAYQISPQSFYQVNPVQTEKLYRLALEYAGLTGDEVVWDLYCGIGTISLFLAQRAKKVYGVEIVPAAVEDARRNAALNGIENVEFFVGKAEEVLPEQFERKKVYADVIVVDPPRKGCDTRCLETIVEMAPKRVVYVSCDPATLARDVKVLRENGYEVRRVRGVEQFSWGGHVECVCLLSNRKPDTKVRSDVDLEDCYRIKDAKKAQN